jgi:hypothetical protein
MLWRLVCLDRGVAGPPQWIEPELILWPEMNEKMKWLIVIKPLSAILLTPVHVMRTAVHRLTLQGSHGMM